MGADPVQRAIAAIESGELVLLPTDTVYGLCASLDESAGRRLAALKGRDATKPMAIIAASVDQLFELLPELDRRSATIARELLPGPYTLIFPNPAQRYPWLNGSSPTTIGIRVAALPGEAQRVLDEVGGVVATSANEPGEASPASLDQVPERIRSACGAELDLGNLPGIASTVIDFTNSEPVVLREGGGSSADAVARIRDALARLDVG
jgi:L-threonylcarbamoyladenylate synthase